MTLTPEYATRKVGRLSLMAFFPRDPEDRAALVEVIMEMVETEEQCDWLIKRALQLFSKWPGLAELRALYCWRWKPLDGIEATSEMFPDGYPSDRPPEPPPPKRGWAGSADPEMDRAVKDLAKVKRMPRKEAAK